MSLPRRSRSPLPSWRPGDPLLATKHQATVNAVAINQDMLLPRQREAPTAGDVSAGATNTATFAYVEHESVEVEIPIEENGVPTGETVTAEWITSVTVAVPTDVQLAAGLPAFWRLELPPAP